MAIEFVEKLERDARTEPVDCLDLAPPSQPLLSECLCSRKRTIKPRPVAVAVVTIFFESRRLCPGAASFI
jgi:hypothetical protein